MATSTGADSLVASGRSPASFEAPSLPALASPDGPNRSMEVSVPMPQADSPFRKKGMARAITKRIRIGLDRVSNRTGLAAGTQ